VGSERFGGAILTVSFALVMLIRQLGTALVFGVFAFGHERRLSLVGIAEGSAAVVGSLVLVPLAGPVGALWAQGVAALAIGIPPLLVVLARELDLAPAAVVMRLVPALWRSAIALGFAAALARAPLVEGLPGAALKAALGFAVFLALAWPLLRRPPLDGYARRLKEGVVARLTGRAA
jgi:hypothetical protein